MDILWIAAAVGFCFAFTLGFAFGTREERKAWVVRAFSRQPHAPNTPHHVEGTFYYIVPEEIFVHDFQRKPRSES